MANKEFTLRGYIEGFLKAAIVVTILAVAAAVAPVEDLPALALETWAWAVYALRELPPGLMAAVLFLPGICVAGLALAHFDKEKHQP